MKLAYVDSCIWITMIEGLNEYRQIIDSKMRALSEDGWIFCVSDIVYYEVLLKPAKNNQVKLMKIYRSIFDKLKIVKNYSDLFKDALLLGQSEDLKGIDLLHVAIARHSNCQRFITTDPHFTQLKSIEPVFIDLAFIKK